MSTANVKNFVGIDISKHTLDLALIRSGAASFRFKVDNTKKGIAKIKKHLIEQGAEMTADTLVVMEHTGLYQRQLVSWLAESGVQICVEMPMRIKTSIGLRRGKTDTLDAQRIAEYGYKNRETLNLWKHPRKALLRVQDLLTNRERLIKARLVLLVPIREMKQLGQESKYFERLNKQAVDGIEKSIEKIEKEIDATVSMDTQLQKQTDLLRSIPGIGRITALHLVCSTNEFTNYAEGKKLACYAGVAPFEHQSGISVKGKTRVHPMANKTLKKYLHLAAVSTLSRQTELKEYFDRKVEQGKNKMLVINAIRNKLVLRAAAVIKRQQPYVDNYVGKAA
jgi:transposase